MDADLARWRAYILAVAGEHPGIGPLAESLKWGEPSFTPLARRIGSSVRLAPRDGGRVALLFICHTGLVEEFRTLYPGLSYEGNRAVVVDAEAPPPEGLSHCITMALTYFLRQRSRPPRISLEPKGPCGKAARKGEPMPKLEDMFGTGGAGTFLGLPPAGDLARETAQIVLIGAAGCTPYGSVGFYCAGGPAAIRAAGVAYGTNLAHANFDLGGPVLPEGVRAVDAGDLPQDLADAPGNRARIFGAVSTVLDKGAVPVLIGGDDSLPIPMLEAYGGRGGSVVILQIDAHVDWRDEVQGERLGLSSTMRRASEMAHVAQIVQVGQRGIGSARMGDWEDALAWGVHFVPGGEVARRGVWRAIDLIPEGADVVICLDLDALDPGIMPAVIGRTAGGLTYWQLLELIGGVAEKARIVGFDMVELMPERDIDGQGALLAAQVLAGVLGIIARQQA